MNGNKVFWGLRREVSSVLQRVVCDAVCCSGKEAKASPTPGTCVLHQYTATYTKHPKTLQHTVIHHNTLVHIHSACVCVCVRAHTHARLRTCVCMSAHVNVYMCAYVCITCV